MSVGTFRGVLALGAAFVLAALPAAIATAQEPQLPPIPAADTVKVYDRPSDDGSTIIVEWFAPQTRSEAIAKAFADAAKQYKKLTEDQAAELLAQTTELVDREAELTGQTLIDVTYHIQVARSGDDFRPPSPGEDPQPDRFVTIEVTPGPSTRKSGAPKYFGLSSRNADYCYAEIVPAVLFPPPEPVVLDEGAARLLALAGVLSESEAARVVAILTNDTPVDELSPQEQADLEWLDGLKLYIRMTQLLHEGVVSESEVSRTRSALVILDGVAQAEADMEALLIASLQDESEEDSSPAEIDEQALSPRKQAEYNLSSRDRAELRWFERLAAWVAKRDQKARKILVAEINAGTYYFRLAVTAGDEGEKVYVVGDDGEPLVLAARAEPNVFKWYKLNNLLFALIFSGVVLAFIRIARHNPNLFIRKIAGLEAVEEAIGRATEMGRSVYFVHGMDTMESLATIAAVNILGQVTRRAAEYDTRVRVMNIHPIVMAVSQEVVQQAYTEAGRPDAYDPDDVALMASGQFSYAAAVAGRMTREQPAAIFLMGRFMAESLLLAETGAATGAIQVAGTNEETQLPFFITTCDYTLIGEELYAASAYLSREPRMLGSLRGQDVGKAFMIFIIVVGVIALTIAAAWGKDLAWFRSLFEAF